MITFTINGQEVQGQDGWTILEVARWHGIDIPTLCHYEAVEPYGACRLCVVEVDDGKRSRVVISCMYPIRSGIQVKTDSPRVANVRRWIVQLLLDESPGAPKIQELAKAFRVTPSRFKKEGVEFACHLCGLCIRACQEVVGVQALTFGNRGVLKEVTAPYHQRSTDCIRCGTCLYVCPTGAMEQLFPQVSAP
ncbi:MAG: (2Fe-2S)-binding protein [Deltaproteobacteria bacterium]|nr:(2Fe-2S)-binding protein [Deltaproteobacteria bacterium]MBI4796417.1 (2Fe-2S)-binding protein [Deltaproteobacteria bacterium]